MVTRFRRLDVVMQLDDQVVFKLSSGIETFNDEGDAVLGRKVAIIQRLLDAMVDAVLEPDSETTVHQASSPEEVDADFVVNAERAAQDRKRSTN